MPLYNLRNKETQEVTEKFLSISAMELFLQEHPEFEQYHSGSALIVTGVDGKKPDQGFRDVLKQIKRRSGEMTTINDW